MSVFNRAGPHPIPVGAKFGGWRRYDASLGREEVSGKDLARIGGGSGDAGIRWSAPSVRPRSRSALNHECGFPGAVRFRCALFSFERSLFAKIGEEQLKAGEPARRVPRFYFVMRNKISAKSPSVHRKKRLRSGEFHPDRATSRSEQRASTVCRHGTA